MFIGKRLKEIRISKHLTQQQLGDMLQVSKVSICGYEQGTKSPSIEIFDGIVNKLDVNPSYLLGLDKRLVSDSKDEFAFKICDEDLKIINELKRHRELYNRLCYDAENEINKISKD